MIQMID